MIDDKFVPLMVTVVPTGPLVGVKLVIVGAVLPPPPLEVSAATRFGINGEPMPVTRS